MIASTEPPNLRPRQDFRTTDHTPADTESPAPSLPAAHAHADPAVGFDGFARALVEAGLIEPAELGEYLAQSGPTGRASGAEALVHELVRDGRLTAYQAAAVLQGKTKGLVIGNYVVLDKVGAGSMGLVFKARHRRMNRVVALKVLPPSFTMNRLAVLRFQREIQAVAQLSHPNIVAAFDADEFKGLHFFVMEYIEGRDLSRLVREEGPLPVGRAVDFTLQAACGLGEAHAQGIIHRDIKPSNLLLDVAGTVKVSDLGIARMQKPFGRPGGPAAGAAELTCDGAMMGTVDYMSPEQAYNSKLADQRSDIYSLGCTLYYLLTGRVPFPAKTLMARLMAHCERPAPSLRSDLLDVPPALDAVVQRMMAKTPEARYPSMDALIVDLEACLTAPPDPSALPTPLPQLTGQSDPNVVSIRPAGLRSVPKAEISGSPVPPPRTSRPKPPPVSTRVVLAATVIGLTLTAIVAERSRGRTGELIVQADVADVRVAITQGGKSIVAPTEPRSFRLPPGDYDVEIAGRPVGLRVVPARVSVARNRTAAVRIERVPAPRPVSAASTPEPGTPKPPPPPPERIGIVHTFRHGEGLVEAVAVSADGRRAVTGGTDRYVRLWDLATRRELGRLAHDGPVYSVAIAPDGRRAVSASGDRTVRLWDLDAARELGRFAGHNKKVTAVAVSPVGGRVLTGGEDAAVRLWDVETRESLATFAHDGGVNAVAFVPDGGLALTAGNDATIRLWNTDGGAEVARFDAGGAVLCLAVSPDGRRALAGCENGKLTVCDLVGRAILRRLEGGPRDWVRSAAFLPGDIHALTGYQGGTLLVWDVESGRIARRFDEGPDGRLGLAALPDGAHALTADTDGRVRLWRLLDEVAPPRQGAIVP